MPHVSLRCLDHHYYFRLPSPVGCPDIEDRLAWWGITAYNLL